MPHTQTPGSTLVLVDGSSYLYRAFHAMPDLRVTPDDRTSQATGAIRGMVNMLQLLRREVPADYAVCVFDAEGPTFRDAIYPEYKANRSPMPEDLRSQIAPIHEVVRLMGWPVLCVQGVEADDVIGTLAHVAAQQGANVVISSGDKDLSQLVNERITVIDTMSGKRRDITGVETEFGVPPRLMLDYQALVGDNADNVPGVPKVGPKTAARWLQQYGSLEALIAHAHDIKGVVGQNLRDCVTWLATGRQLLQIKTDCNLQAEVPGLPRLDALAALEPDMQGLHAFFEKYGFKSLLKNGGRPHARPPTPSATDAAMPDLFGQTSAAGSEVSETCYETIADWAALDALLQRLQSTELAALDTETTSLNAMQARIVGLSISVQPGQGAYIPLAHDYPDAPKQLPLEEVLQRLKPWLEDAARAKLGQHIKYDRHVFANHGIQVHGYVHDTMLQSYVLEVHRPHNLESLAERHLGRRGISYETLCGKGAQQIPFSQVTMEQAATYACEDADLTLDVHRVLWARLQANEALRKIYELEIACSEVLFRMERNGVLIDALQLAEQSHELGQRVLALEDRAHALAGQPFNLGSPKQIAEIFFGKLGLPIVKKTATGAPSTDEEVLEKLSEDYPLPQTLLEYRSLAKLKSTYTDKLSQLADPGDGRVHTHYAQAVAVTGRLASNDPNLQNIPVRTVEGRRIREAFIAAPGNVIASADYSQIELRIMAHISGDKALMDAFLHGMDVHRATAAEVFGVAPDQVSSEQRRYAKVINFGLIYGMSSFGLARSLGIENKAAAAYIDRYFQRYPGVKTYMDEIRLSAKSKGYVETVFGRRLYLPEINSPNGPRRAAAERAAINAPMQGTAADLIKMSMVQVQAALEQRAAQLGQAATRMIMQVHDELVFELPQAETPWVRTEIARIMCGVATLKVPLVVDVGVGPNWEQAH